MLSRRTVNGCDNGVRRDSVVYRTSWRCSFCLLNVLILWRCGNLHSTLPLVVQPDSVSGRPLPAVVRQLTSRSMALNQPRRLQFGGGGSAVVTVTTFNGDVHINRGPRRVPKEQ